MPAILWAVCVSYTAARLRHGWVPYDAGALGESARRVLAGQLPHRDFDELYTGGLSYLNALSFRALGTSLLAMRITLLVAFALWLPAVYAIARRVARTPLAAAVTLLAAAWSVSVYPEAMPSWYNLFFATFGVAALFRHLDDGRRRWLLAAGVCAALSCLIKIIGLYFVGAALLFLVYHEQDLARARIAEGTRTAGDRIASALLTLAVLAFDVMLLELVRHDMSAGIFVQFVVPGAAMSALLVWREWRMPPTAWKARVAGLSGLVLPFAVGVILPLTLAVIPYVVTGSVGALVDGVFVRPVRRLDFAHHDPHGAVAFVLFAAASLVAPRAARSLSIRGRVETQVLFAIAIVAIPVASSLAVIYRLAWVPMRVLVPLTSVWAVWHLARHEPGIGGDASDARVFLLATAAALCGLVQFPFGVPNYFFYVGPLAALAAVALAARRDAKFHRWTTACLGAYVAFAVCRIHTRPVFTIGFSPQPEQQHAALPLARAGIDVSPVDSAMYQMLVRELRAHSHSAYTYAGPDCPEVYFLSGLRNPTRTLFDFFDDSTGRTPRILSELAAHRVTAVAINARGDFSGPMTADLAGALAARFPLHEQIGRFTVRWRE